MTSNDNVHLKVHLTGTIAYVPDQGGLWALMPNALLPTPARWQDTQERDLYRARSPHVGLLLVEKHLIVNRKETGPIGMVFERFSKHRMWTPSTALIPLVGVELKFVDLPVNGGLSQHPNVGKYFPQMSEISARHSRAARQFNPDDESFDTTTVGFQLSSALKLSTGTLAVEGYFGKPTRPLDFAYVAASGATTSISDRVWERKVANKLLWDVALPKGQRSVTIQSTDWSSGYAHNYKFQAPEGKNEIDITIMHAEIDVPVLFLKDPLRPGNIRPLPDPDFEMLYPLSNVSESQAPWRVPVPRMGEGGGLTEKPCTGGMFQGFA